MAKAINDMFVRAKKLGVLNALNEEGKATMTEFDIIKSLDIDHMAEWLSNTWDCNLCSEYQRLSDNPLCSDEHCDNRCIDHCREWLMSEVKGNEY